MLIILRIGQYIDRFLGRFLPVQGYEELDTQRRAQMFVLAHQLSPLVGLAVSLIEAERDETRASNRRLSVELEESQQELAATIRVRLGAADVN